MAFIYHLPAAPWPVSELQMAAVGLGHLAGAGYGSVQSMGPGGPGVLLFRSSEPPGRQLFTPTAQDWSQIFDSPQGPWLGVWKDSRPGPADLACKDQTPGKVVKLADGKDWLVPVAQLWEEDAGRPVWCCALECSLRKQGAKLVEGAVVTAQRALWEVSRELAAGFLPPKSRKLTTLELFGLSARVLGHNYHVAEAEVSALDLFSGESMDRLVAACLDLDSLAEIINGLKKKAGPGGS